MTRTPVKLTPEGSVTHAAPTDGDAPCVLEDVRLVRRKKLLPCHATTSLCGIKREREISNCDSSQPTDDKDSLFIDDVEWTVRVEQPTSSRDTPKAIEVHWDTRVALPALHAVEPHAAATPCRRRPLDADQVACVTHDINSSLLICAGAGSGKTETIVHRIAHMLQQGVAAYHILGLSFSRASAEELRNRVAQVLPACQRQQAKHLRMKTIHSFCLAIVRKHHERGRDVNIYDERKCRSVAQQAISATSGRQEHAGLGQRRHANAVCSEDVRALMKHIEHTKRSITPQGGKMRALNLNTLLDRQFQQYQRLMDLDNAIDFSDIQLMALHVLCIGEGSGTDEVFPLHHIRQQYRYLVVDEAQDVDVVQFEILCRLAGDAPKVSCVGDPRQAIYGFRGATKNFFAQWTSRFPLTQTKYLCRNYRSCEQIVSLSNSVAQSSGLADCVSVVGPAKGGESHAPPVVIIESPTIPDLELRLLDFLRRMLKTYKPCDVGILVRKGVRGKETRVFLQNQGIPCRMLYRRDPTAAQLMRALLAHLRCVVNPHTAHVRVLDALEHLGVEKSFLTVLRVERQQRANADSDGPVSYFSILQELVVNRFLVPQQRLVPRLKKHQKLIEDWVELIEECRLVLLSDAPPCVSAKVKCEAPTASATADSGCRVTDAPDAPSSVLAVVSMILEKCGFQQEDAAPPVLAAEDEDDGVDPVVHNAKDMHDVFEEALSNIRLSGEPYTGVEGLCSMLDVLEVSSGSDYCPAAGIGSADGVDSTQKDRSLASLVEQQRALESNRVTVSTVHKAKGLEWPLVFVMDVTDGEMPICRADSGRCDEEEKRIFYVACSRAKDALYLLAQNNGGDRRPSRFLDDIRSLCVTV